MVIGDLDDNGKDDVIISFGASFGIWIRMNNDSWVHLHNLSAQQMVTGNIDGLPSMAKSTFTKKNQRLPSVLENPARFLPKAGKTVLPPAR